MEEQVKKIMADIFVCPVEAINNDTAKEDLHNWDSLQHLIFASKLEQSFNVKLSPEEINSMITFKRIIEILNSKQT